MEKVPERVYQALRNQVQKVDTRSTDISDDKAVAMGGHQSQWNTADEPLAVHGRVERKVAKGSSKKKWISGMYEEGDERVPEVKAVLYDDH